MNIDKNKNKNIVILGSTGSIGKMTLEVLRSQKIPGYKVLGLSTNSNIELIKAQIEEFHPKHVCIYDQKAYQNFVTNNQDLIKKYSLNIYTSDEGLETIAGLADLDFLMASLVGAIGLLPICKAIKNGKNVAIANKEPLVIAGDFVMEMAKKYGAQILPVDSEHSAIFQCLLGEKKDEVSRIILTASGGPFYDYKSSDLASVTKDQALKHPRWKMGPKITIDSATLMNKGFEVIEAYYLFGLNIEQIEVIIHPESIIHSMVEFVDGSIKAHLGKTDMRIPIQYALTYPDRQNNFCLDDKLSFAKLASLNFKEVDYSQFKCLKLAFESLKKGHGYPVVLNAVNEVLVHRFLKDEIKFTDIPNILEDKLSKYIPQKIKNIDDVLALDKESRNF